MAEYNGTSRLAIRKERESRLQQRIGKRSGPDTELAQANVKGQRELDGPVRQIGEDFYGDRKKSRPSGLAERDFCPGSRPTRRCWIPLCQRHIRNPICTSLTS